MAPVKFEEHLKDKLEKRTLTPSINSWEKLSKRLDAEEKKRKTPIFWWLGFAASVVIFLAISIQYFGKDTNTTIEEIVIEETINPEQNNINNETKSQDNLQLVNSNKDEDFKDNLTENNKKEAALNTQKAVVNTKLKQQLVNQTNALNTQKQHSNSFVAKDKIELVETPILEKVVANVSEFKGNSAVMDAELDSLLTLANKSILKNKELQKNNNVVNANSLLIDVEDEMGQSFRTKVYEALKGSYKTVKTAVVERKN